MRRTMTCCWFCMQALSRAFSKGNVTLPTPIETHVTRWGDDPLARGAYSYYATGNPKNITGVLGWAWYGTMEPVQAP
jgi:hypothetical protein